MRRKSLLVNRVLGTGTGTDTGTGTETKKPTTTKAKVTVTKRIVMLATVTAMLGGVLGVCTGCGKDNKEEKSFIDRMYTADELSGTGSKDSNTTTKEEEAKGTESEDYKTISKAITEMYDNNGYAKVWVSNDKSVFMQVNKDGESYISDGRIGLGKSHKVLSVNTEDNKVYETTDGTYLNELECALILTRGTNTDTDTDKQGTGTIGASLKKISENDSASGSDNGSTTGTDTDTDTNVVGNNSNNNTYKIKIEGKESLLRFYKLLSKSDEYANMGYEVLCQEVKDPESVYMEYDITLSDKQGLSAICLVGDKDTKYNVWLLDGYIKTYNWKLPSRVYGDYLKTEKEFNDVVEQITSEQTRNLLKSNNDIEVYKNSPTYEEYINASNKNEMLAKAIEEMEANGLTISKTEVELKQRLKDGYTDEFERVPLLKMLAYYVDNADIPLESEETIETERERE